MRNKIGIIGVVIAFVGFSTYYCYAYFYYSLMSDELKTLAYIPLMAGICLLSFQLYLNDIKKRNRLIYGLNSILWASLTLSYYFKDVIHIIKTKTFIFSVFALCLLIGFIAYFCRRKWE